MKKLLALLLVSTLAFGGLTPINGGGGGSGTVTSVDVSAPSILTSTGGPVTTSGTIALDLATEAANLILSGPATGAAAVPTFRALVAADIPTGINAANIADGSVSSSEFQFINTVTSNVQTQINGKQATLTPGSVSTSTTGVTVGSGANSTVGPNVTVNVQTASGSQPGLLSSADWTTFNSKFTLPSLTAGSILFSDGSTIAQNNGALYWDNATQMLSVGQNTIVPFAISALRTDTDPAGESGGIYIQHNDHTTVSLGSLNFGAYFQEHANVDTTISTGANAGVLFQAYRNNGVTDDGFTGFLAGAFGGVQQTATGPNAVSDIVAGSLVQNQVTSGTANTLADFYALPTTVSGATIGQAFGIYIPPNSAGVKSNWLAGTAQLGGTSFSLPSQTLNVHGKTYGEDNPGNDLDALGAEFHGVANVTVDGSEQAIGVQTSSLITVQSGATDDKEISSILATTQRGDGSDEGTLEAMAGTVNLMIHNPGAAGVTNKAIMSDNVLVLQGGTVGDVYDFRSEVAHAGGTISGQHYGIFVKPDGTNPVQSFLADHATIGGTSVTPATEALAVNGNIEGIAPFGGLTIHTSDGFPSARTLAMRGGDGVNDGADTYVISGNCTDTGCSNPGRLVLTPGYNDDGTIVKDVEIQNGSGVERSGLRLYEGSGGSNFTRILAASSQTADLTIVLPSTAGSSGYALTTDGAGNTSWAAASGGMTTSMNNADVTTAIPDGTDLQWTSGGSGARISTGNVTGVANSGPIVVTTGSITDAGQSAGSIQVQPGAGGAGSGAALNLYSSAGDQLSAPVNIKGADSTTAAGAGADVNVTTGSSGVGGVGGNLNLFSLAGGQYGGTTTVYGGNCTDAACNSPGPIFLSPGAATDGGFTEDVYITTQVGGLSTSPGLRLFAVSGGGSVRLKPAASVTGLVDITLPVNDGDVGQALVTDGSGVTSWANSLSRLFSHITDANNGTTVETDLYSDTTAANTLLTNSDVIHAQYSGTFNDVTATCQLKTYFGGTLAFDSGALTVAAVGSFDIDMTCIRESSSVVRCSTRITSSGASSEFSTYTRITGLTLSGTNIIKLTGQAAGATGGSNDCTATMGYVEKK